MSDWTSDSSPFLTRFRIATVGASDLSKVEDFYCKWLGYHVRERSMIAADLAHSWGTPAMAGRACLILSTDGAPDDYIRVVQITPVPEYKALTTFGWAAFEIIVDDTYRVHELLQQSGCRILAGPKPLQFMPSIVAMQVEGPAGECLYFTMESGDRSTSILPSPRGLIDRPFILVVAGPDFDAMRQWYGQQFDLRQRPLRRSKIDILQRALGQDSDFTINMTTAGLREHGYLFEFDEYPADVAGPRPTHLGELPPGCAMASIAITDISKVAHMAIQPPVRRQGFGYDGQLVCTVKGPSGEWIEFIEEML